MDHVLFVTRNWYKKNSVPNGMSDASETGTGFLVPVFGTDFWLVWFCYHYCVYICVLSSGQIKMLACLRVSLALSWSLVDFSDDIAELVGYACRVVSWKWKVGFAVSRTLSSLSALPLELSRQVMCAVWLRVLYMLRSIQTSTCCM